MASILVRCCLPKKPDLVWGLIASLFIANTMLLVLNLPLVGLWVRLLSIPKPWLYAGILVFAVTGTIAAKPSVVELSMLAAHSGCSASSCGGSTYPIAPVVVGTHPRAGGRSAAPSRAADQSRRPDGAAGKPDFGNAARDCIDRAHFALRPQGTSQDGFHGGLRALNQAFCHVGRTWLPKFSPRHPREH